MRARLHSCLALLPDVPGDETRDSHYVYLRRTTRLSLTVAFKKAEEGTEAEMKNKAGVSLDSVGKHHHEAKMESNRDLAAAKSQDADDDDI